MIGIKVGKWTLALALSLFLLTGKQEPVSATGIKLNLTTPVRDTIIFPSFPAETALTLENVFKLGDGGTRKLFVVDSGLLVWHINSVSDHFFGLYSLPGGKVLGRYLKEGSRFGETLSSLSAGLYKNTIWLQELNLHKFITVDLNSSGTGAIREYKTSQDYYNVHLKDSLRLIANGAPHSRYSMQEIDLRTDSIITEYGSVGEPPAGIPFFSWKSAQESFLFMRDDGKKAAMAHRHSDQVDFFDLQTHESTVTRGPENYEVDFKPFVNVGFDVMALTNKTRYGFLNGSTTDKYIYLLYSGYNVYSRHFIYGKYVYVYDWDGRPVRRITLDRHVAAICVSPDDKLIYAFDADSRFILKGTLPVN